MKTSLNGDATLSADGFRTFTAAPKFGYNAGLSQLYVGAGYVSKNEHYMGTVSLASGNDLGFDVMVTTDTWAPNAGMRTVIQRNLEVLMEVAFEPRHPITVGVGYRWQACVGTAGRRRSGRGRELWRGGRNQNLRANLPADEALRPRRGLGSAGGPAGDGLPRPGEVPQVHRR